MDGKEVEAVQAEAPAAAAETKQETPCCSTSAADIWARLKAKTSASAVAPAAKPAEPAKPATTTVKEVYDFAGEKVECVV